MAFCRNCGTELPEGSAFCQNCGASTQPKTNEQADKFDFSEKVNEFTNTADTTSEYDPADIEANKLMSIFSYVGILFLVPLLAAKNSKFARFHANQGLVLFICIVAVNLLRYIPYAGGILGAVGSLIAFALSVFGIVNAVSGKAKELPVIGKIKLLK